MAFSLRLLFVLLSGLHIRLRSCEALYCIKKYYGYPDEPGDKVMCFEPGKHYVGCFSLTELYGGDSTPFEEKGCQDWSEADFECFRKECQSFNFTISGNCIHGPPGQLHTVMKKCKRNPSSRLLTPKSGSETDGYFTMCTCNDGDLCNENCVCNPNYGMCGAVDGCAAKPVPPSTHTCYCEKPLPLEDPLQCDKNGERKCFPDGDKSKGCYSISKRRQPSVIKDCVHNLTGLQCIFRQMKAAPVRPGSYSACVTGTNADWIVVAQKCYPTEIYQGTPKKLEHPSDRLKACYCTGDLCNEQDVAWNEDDPKVDWSDLKNCADRWGKGKLTWRALTAVMVGARICLYT